MKKEYEVTEKLADIDAKARACEKLRDIYVKLPFMHKRAVKAAHEAEKCKFDFWYGVYQLYPNLKKGNLIYFPSEKVLTEHKQTKPNGGKE